MALPEQASAVEVVMHPEQTSVVEVVARPEETLAVEVVARPEQTSAVDAEALPGFGFWGGGDRHGFGLLWGGMYRHRGPTVGGSGKPFPPPTWGKIKIPLTDALLLSLSLSPQNINWIMIGRRIAPIRTDSVQSKSN